MVHISSGVSALIAALLIGKRLGFGSEPMPPHNMTYTVIGAALLWVGWFGFNAGSALNASGLAASAFAATHFAAAAGGLAWAAMEWLTRGKPSVLGTCSGVVAGLVCITPAAGYRHAHGRHRHGGGGGRRLLLRLHDVKIRLGYDDSLDAFGVHGVGGTLGAILTGVFATRATGDLTDGKLAGPAGRRPAPEGPDRGRAHQWGLAIVGTFVILKVLDAAMGLRVSREAEIEGLDLSQHGEEGYIFI